MCKFKMKLQFNEELVSTKTELLNFKITLAFAKLDMVGSRFVSNGLIFADIPVNIHLVTFLLLSNVSELSTGAKTKKFCQNFINYHHL